MSFEALQIERDGPVLKVTLNRPQARNALSPEMLMELGQVFTLAWNEEAVRAVLLRAAGGTFSAGGDFRNMQRSEAASGRGTADTALSNRRFGTFLEMLRGFPKGLVTLVEGPCMGGGVGLVAVSDWVIAEKSAQIGTPEVTVGIVPAQIAPFIVERIGRAQAQRLLAFGLRLSAAEACRIGLVHEVADGAADLSAKGLAALNQVLRAAPGAVAETKKLVALSQSGDVGAALDTASHMFANALAGEAREGISAFLEKRKPGWTATLDTM
ncbi:MAG: enoyl-CoA hydratase-related protein [Hyphomicrobiaceae bacterium]|nr:enoyl-CoA hydratase-related protein [Hyphomicrobiaceae bacterium]